MQLQVILMEDKKEEKIIQDKSGKKFNLYNIFVGLAILLGIILITNIFLTLGINKEIGKNIELAKEKSKPAKIELAVIKNSNCNDCFDISTIVSHVKNANVEITKEEMFEFDSNEGREFIIKYKIEKIPTVIVTGEVDKVNIQGLERKENAFLLTKLDPPYTTAATGKVEGRVALFYLKDSTCEKCTQLNSLIAQIKGAGVKIVEEKNIDIKSDEGKNIIQKYNIDFAPTIIMSKDAEVYEVVQQVWPQIGSKEADGSYVLRTVSPPFINLTTGKLRGIVDMVYLTDNSCAECYNVSVHKQILASPQSFAMKIEKEETFDVSDPRGKELTLKYNITQVPTVILSPEANAYPSEAALRQFFSKESDGYYIFRKASVVGTYRDLTTDEIVKPQQREE